MRWEASQSVENIDVTHRRVLSWLLLAKGVTPAQWNDGVRNKLLGMNRKVGFDQAPDENRGA